MAGIGDLREVAGVLRAADKIKEYQIILEAQEKMLEQQEKIAELKSKLAKLEEKKKYKYAEGHKWMLSPDNPSLKFCPTCLNRDGFENPMGDYDDGGYCRTCNKAVE